MTCRDKVLNCAKHIVHQTGRNEFTVQEIINCMQLQGTAYDEQTIRIHVTSKMCANAPKNGGASYDDFEGIGRGLYRLKYL